MNESGGDWTPEKGPIVVTAGGSIIPPDPCTGSRAGGGVATPATISAVKATVRERNWYNAPIVMELPMTLSGSTVTPTVITVPNRVGTFWYDIQVTLSDGQKPTIISDSFQILPQTTVVA